MSYKNVDGKVKFTIDDMWGLADATDMSVAQVWQALQALSVYGEIDTGVEEFTNQLEALGEQAEFLSTNVDTGKLVVDYEKLREFMSGSGASESEWMKMKDWLYLLNEIGEVEMANVPDVKEGWKNYYDFTEEMQKSSETAKEAKESLAGMVSEAQAAASGLSNVTPQVATMNNFLNDMRLAGNDQGANDMLARLSAAAQAAGGSLEVVDGKIASLKDSAGKDADWKFLE